MAEENNPTSKPTPAEKPTPEIPAKDANAAKGGMGKAVSGLFGIMAKKKGGKATGKAASPKKSVLAPTVFDAQKINLKMINQVLVGFLIVLFFLLIYVSTQERPNISTVLADISSIKLPEIESKSMSSFEKLSYYLDQTKSRNIFTAFQEIKPEPPKPKVAEVKKPEPPPKPVVPIQSKVKDIKLIGISWGENPKAMIRDLGSQSVMFLGIGEIIDGTDLEIKDIMKHEVILTSEGQEMSLL